MVAQERQRHGGEMKMIVSLVNLVTFKAGKEGAISLFFPYVHFWKNISVS